MSCKCYWDMWGIHGWLRTLFINTASELAYWTENVPRKIWCAPSVILQGGGTREFRSKVPWYQLKVKDLHIRCINPWQHCTGCEVSSLEISKSHLDVVLCNLLWVALLEQGYWTRWLQRSFPTFSWNLKHSVILWFCESYMVLIFLKKKYFKSVCRCDAILSLQKVRCQKGYIFFFPQRKTAFLCIWGKE